MVDGVYIVDMEGNYYKTDSDSGCVVRATGKDDATEFSLLDAEFMIKFREKEDWWIVEKANQSNEAVLEEVEPSNVKDFVSYAKGFVDALNDIGKRISELEEKLTVEQGRRSDILHHIELHDLSVPEKQQAYEMLEQCLRRRRRIKDELEELKEIFKARSRLQSALQYIEGLETKRHYNPRQLTELFA